jgi:hypothetical protein
VIVGHGQADKKTTDKKIGPAHAAPARKLLVADFFVSDFFVSWSLTARIVRMMRILLCLATILTSIALPTPAARAESAVSRRLYRPYGIRSNRKKPS